MADNPASTSGTFRFKKILRGCGILLLGLVVLIAFARAYGALHFDGPSKWFAVVQVVAILAVSVFARGWSRKLAIFAAWFVIVLSWWLTLKPTNGADWQPDVAMLPSAEIDGDTVTIHNVRNCEYRTVSDYSPRWETRTAHLSKITGIDIAIHYWGSPYMAHPIISFQFSDAPPLCFSIETRKKVGQNYSAIVGIYRQFPLICIAADERDVIRVRANCRKNQDVYLYRTAVTPAGARERFLEYVRTLDQMREKPCWYNALTTSCTTAIRHQHPAAERMKWDWRLLVNGKGDELMCERHAMEAAGLPFAELKKRAFIEAAAKVANDAPCFSARTREGRPGIRPAFC